MSPYYVCISIRKVARDTGFFGRAYAIEWWFEDEFQQLTLFKVLLKAIVIRMRMLCEDTSDFSPSTDDNVLRDRVIVEA